MRPVTLDDMVEAENWEWERRQPKQATPIDWGSLIDDCLRWGADPALLKRGSHGRAN